VRRILLSFITLTFPFFLWANPVQVNPDSLESILAGKSGKDRLIFLNETAASLRESEKKLAFAFAKEADSLATVLKDTSAKSRALENIGWIYYRQGNWSKSFEFSSKAYQLAFDSNDKLQAARLMNNLGALYYEQMNYPKAIEHFKKGYFLATEVNDLSTRIRSLNNVALNFTQSGNQDSAYFYAKKSIRLNEDAGSPYHTSFAHRVIGDIYLAWGKYDTAQVIFLKSLELSRLQKVKSFEAGVLHRLGNAYLLGGKLKEAKEILTYSTDFCLEEGFLDELAMSHKYLAKVFEKEGNIQKAYAHLQSYQTFNDSLVNKSNRDRLTLLQGMFEENLEKSELELLKVQNENQSYRLATFKRNILFLSLGLGVIALLLIRMYFLNRGVSKTNEDLIDKQRKIEEQNQVLEAQSAELSSINETKNKLFSILGHDLRGPVGHVKAVVDLLAKNQLDQSEFEILILSLKKDIDTVNFTLNNTLQWSMAQMEGFKIHAVEFNLRTVVDHSIALLESSFKEKNLQLSNQMDEEVLAFADPNLVEVAIRNVLNNAAKFSNTGEGISIFSEISRDWVSICIVDQGVGMSEDRIQSILSDSYSLTKSKPGTQKEKGSGLGLQLTKEFVRKNRGEVFIESHLGSGTKFCIQLPRTASSFKAEVPHFQEASQVQITS
jgi:signal transduction histidine kinase